MNERHASGYAPGYDGYGYDAYSTGSYQTVGTGFSGYGSPDQFEQPHQPPHIPQSQQTQQTQQYDAYDPYAAYDQTSAYGYSSGYGSGSDQTGTYAAHDPYVYGAAQPEQQQSGQPAGATYYDTGTYDTSAFWQQDGQAAAPQQQDWDSGQYPAYGYGYGYGYDANGDTGVYEQLADPYAYAAAPAPTVPGQRTPEAEPYPEPDTYADEADPYAEVPEPDVFGGTEASQDDEPVRHDYAADGPDGERGAPVARSRRRKPAKRSALLTIAVPSVAVMGVAAVGAAAVGGVGAAQGSAKTQADGRGGTGNAPTTQLDRQLSGVSRGADDFATRASRTQERIDLKDRQAAAAKAKAEAAARKEALRPKFVLPVTQRGLSAYFGQAGEHWMMLHTGIDFPVQVGTPVMAATDGTVRTQWNSSYGNMAIVTAPDGTETWYCHLSSTKIRSGKVKAGTVIAYSGNTGNTTGPHLHFEVRPHGGSPIDPLPWLLAHGLDPR